MPFSGPGTYLETMDEFIGHWTDVNAALAPNPMVLPTGYVLADLQTDRDDTATEMAQLEDFINAMEMHRTARDNQEPALHEDMKQLGAYIRGALVKSTYAGLIPGLPRFTSRQDEWRKAMDDSASLWSRVNTAPPAGFTPPLVIPNTTTLAQFNTKVTAMKATFEAYNLAAQDADLAILDRDAIYTRVRSELNLYRATVSSYFAEDHPLVLSIPLLNPLPGHTPDPVALTGFWDASKDWAEFNWTASADPDIANYVLRRSGSNPYSGATEQHVATIDPGTLTITTDEGLLTPGGTMRFKLYVVLSTGNERGSNVVEITRPL
jgi:hypothetical protein